MTGAELQTWLNNHGAALLVDGKPGALTREAIKQVFRNPCAPAVSDSDVAATALQLGCTAKQVRVVAKVESGGAAFDTHGRPKLLFERHWFHRLTGGRYSVASFSNATGGGYGEDSWEKLTQAACKDASSAFAAASWGKFQVLGAHWAVLEYGSPIDMAYSTVTSEAASYVMLSRFVKAMGLQKAMAEMSANKETCRDFARGFNGPKYEAFDYHLKLARAMA